MSTDGHDFEHALLRLNGWLGRAVRLLVVVREGAPADGLPPSGPADGWHVLVVYEGVLGRPPVVSDMERQLAVGTYQLGNGPLLKVLLDGLPCDKAVSVEDDRLAFYLRGSAAVVVFNVLDLDS